jgi:peptidyl-prolyl cis-trans isomerase SurA
MEVLAFVAVCSLFSSTAAAQQGVVDEVIWVVGDEAILRSDVEMTRLQASMEGVRWERDPDCAIPEQIAVQKLFLHQAAIDSIEVTETEIASQTEMRLEYMINQIGSREKLEEYRKQSISQIRESMHDDLRDQMLIQRMKEHLSKDITVTPAEVRRYFRDLPADSIPYVPTMVEVQIISQTPRIDPEEINRVKNELRDYTDRVTRGEATFQTLARLYSQDPGSARRGGELDYTGRGTLDPAFASVAFNLSDPKKISKIVESEFGYHIIQLVDKRGDKIKVRHILLKPEVSDSAITQSLSMLDSLATDIRKGTVPPVLQPHFLENKFTFEDAVTFFSDDKDTRNNKGLMANRSEQGQTSRFQLQDLPAEVAKVVDTMAIGQISAPFTMINERGKTVCAIAKLKNRIDGHKATITEDFQLMKDIVVAKRREEALRKWVTDKIKSTYVRVNDEYRNCNFEYEGWVR